MDNQVSEPFVEFVERYFDNAEGHLFFCLSPEGTHSLRRRQCVHFKSDFRNTALVYMQLARLMYVVDKIIIHGIRGAWVTRMFFVQPWLLKKCYWVIWGWDLYAYRSAGRNLRGRLREIRRRRFISRVGHLVTCVEGDVELARQWYGARGQYHECLMYPSNVYKPMELPSREDSTVHIQVGNSADPGNEYADAFKLLAAHKNEDIQVYAILSYGPKDHAAEIAALGREVFGDRFQAVTEFMDRDKYVEFLSRIDIAIFNHRRQQAMGNIITLLGLGKKVYVRRNTTHKRFLEGVGIKSFAVEELNLELLDTESARRNRSMVRKRFSTGELIKGYKEIFE